MARILVVDDDSVIRELLVEVLEDESGHDVIVASNGQEALEKLGQADIDAVVCDINMPVMDGLELVRNIRSTPKYEDLPVLMISAAARLEHIDPDLDVELMLEKPFELNSLLACVGYLLNGVRAGARAGVSIGGRVMAEKYGVRAGARAGSNTVRVTRRRAACQLERIVQRRRQQPRFGGSSAN